ncbi:mucin-17-like [Ylistrum balloti]|uniref:mucin-17-like n=1 Tax=Ylistrum balloti TaxID=509963 RepID=UPI002905B32E|nr:mucin-17-like [Ylistrum balloti]
MSQVSESGDLPPREDLSPTHNNTSSVPGHYINTSALLAQDPDTQHQQISEIDSEIRESSFLSNGVDDFSDVGELESDVEDIENNSLLLDTFNKREIENGGVSKRTVSFVDPSEPQYDNKATMEQDESIEKPKTTRKYLQRKRLKLLVNKVMEKFKANVRNQRPLRLHMNVKPKQAWDYGPLTTGAYNDIGDMFYTTPFTEWTIEGQINAEDTDKSVVHTQEDTPNVVGSPEKEERRFNSPSTDNITVLADAYIVDTDEDKHVEEESVHIQDSKSRATSAAAISTVCSDVGTVDVPLVTSPRLTSTQVVSAVQSSLSVSEPSTSVALASSSENTPLHVVTVTTDNPTPSPTKGLSKCSPAPAVTSPGKPVQRSAPVTKVNNQITFISSTYEKPKPNVTFARSTTSIPINVTDPIHPVPPSGETALQREDTWGSRAPLPSLASHDSMKFDEESSETSSSSPQNKRKIIVTLPDISTDVEEQKKVQNTQITSSNEPRNAFPSAKTSKSLPRQSRKSPPNYTLEGSARTLARKQSDLPTLKITGSNEEAFSSSLFRIAPGNTTKGSIEIVTSENASAGSDSVSTPEVVETIPHVAPAVASIPKLHGENPLLSVKGTNVSNSNLAGECIADSSSSDSIDLSKNALGNRLSIVIVNRKRAKACRQRHKRKSAHESEPEILPFRSSYTRKKKDMEYTGPFIERSKTLEFPSLTPGKVWNPDLEATAIRANPETHKDSKKNLKSPKLTCLRGSSDKDVNPLGSVPQSYKLNGHMSDFLYRVFVRQNLASQSGSAGKKPTQSPLPEVPSTYKPFRSLTFVQSNPSVRLYRQPNWSPDKASFSAENSVKLGIVNNPSFVVL